MSCIPGQHKLREVYVARGEHPGSHEVVRWCKQCGAVVVDVDFDGRTQPGAVMKMVIPNVSK